MVADHLSRDTRPDALVVLMVRARHRGGRGIAWIAAWSIDPAACLPAAEASRKVKAIGEKGEDRGALDGRVIALDEVDGEKYGIVARPAPGARLPSCAVRADRCSFLPTGPSLVT